MSIRPSPLLGYNNNVRHKGRVFHIQTEDSGVKYGHIMTHVFADGGRILKSVKTSYAEYIGNERMAEIVREMMKQQHKAMFIALRDGKFDVVAEATPESAAASRALVAETPPQPVLPGSRDSKQQVPAIPPPLPHHSAGHRPPASRMTAPEAPLERPLRETEELTLDIDSLERAGELPPPPANLLRERTGGVASAGSAAPALPMQRPSSTTISVPTSERRYAPTRPASIFGQARPQQGKSIFGEDLMSDKSLDEVILSYLADDTDGDEK
jgi:hypothetical protein